MSQDRELFLSLQSTIVDDGWRQQMATLLFFFSTAPHLVTSSAECSYNHSTLLCRPSAVFVFLGDINHLHYPPRLSMPNFPALPLVTCPKYCSFIRATFPINSLSRPIVSNIDILVGCSFQEIPNREQWRKKTSGHLLSPTAVFDDGRLVTE